MAASVAVAAAELGSGAVASGCATGGPNGGEGVVAGVAGSEAVGAPEDTVAAVVVGTDAAASVVGDTEAGAAAGTEVGPVIGSGADDVDPDGVVPAADANAGVTDAGTVAGGEATSVAAPVDAAGVAASVEFGEPGIGDAPGIVGAEDVGAADDGEVGIAAAVPDGVAAEVEAGVPGVVEATGALAATEVGAGTVADPVKAGAVTGVDVTTEAPDETGDAASGAAALLGAASPGSFTTS